MKNLAGAYLFFKIGLVLGLLGILSGPASAAPRVLTLKFSGSDAFSLFKRLHRDAKFFEGALYSSVGFELDEGKGTLRCVRKMGKTNCLASVPAVGEGVTQASIVVIGAEAGRLAQLIGAFFSTGDRKLLISCGSDPAQGGARCTLDISTQAR